ncbi:MAG TPA: DNA polymerase III subunit epsilon [Verrucomicrobiae bacterium]|nr:DNA polymerase III subunit epsilon [Verrucomicrobiae bacterium]
MAERQIVLDTETTGLEVTQGHRLIEIGCLELVNRRLGPGEFHHYLNPEREIDRGALEVHGITRSFLAEKPRFADVAQSLVEFLRGAEVIIHNAEFDVGFLNMELQRAGYAERIESICKVTDTWQLARKLHPGQKNGLDALCKRYSVDNSSRDLHGAQLDARLLAEVYLAMTGGQSKLTLERIDAQAPQSRPGMPELPEASGPLLVIAPDMAEIAAHQERLRAIEKKAGRVLWHADLPPAAAA